MSSISHIPEVLQIIQKISNGFYNSQGRHLGEFDSNNGSQIKPADNSRTIQK
jgi:Cytotoxic